MNKALNKMAVQATINGESTAFLCSPGQVLAEVLRDELELIGTKIGCNTGDCGACSVLLDNRLVCSAWCWPLRSRVSLCKRSRVLPTAVSSIRYSKNFWSTVGSSAASVRRGWWSQPRRS